MEAWKQTAGVIGALGVLVLVTACSKSLQNTGMDGSTATSQPPAATKAKTVDIGKAGDSDIATASSAFPSLSSVEPGESLTAGKGGKDQIIQPGNIVVAKADSSDAARRRAEDLQREQLATAAAGLEDVFFAFDSWQLTAEAKQALMVDSEWIKSNADKSILIEGHCDERGTQAYNLVLGEKRAKAVQKYLSELGVQGGRVGIVSYGKERPFCKDRAESCYQKNRRGHIVLRAN